jgi:hypothetical protein
MNDKFRNPYILQVNYEVFVLENLPGCETNNSVYLLNTF